MEFLRIDSIPIESCRLITAMMVLHNKAVINNDKFDSLLLGVDEHVSNPHGDNINQAGQDMRVHYTYTYFA